MIIWTGWGILAIGMALVAMAVAVGIGVAISGTSDQPPAYFVSLGFALAGLGNVWLGRRLNRNSDRVLVDPETGEAVMISRRHTLFFVRVEHWGIVLLALAPISLVFAITGTFSA